MWINENRIKALKHLRKTALTPTPLGACPSGVGKRCKNRQKTGKKGAKDNNIDSLR